MLVSVSYFGHERDLLFSYSACQCLIQQIFQSWQRFNLFLSGMPLFKSADLPVMTETCSFLIQCLNQQIFQSWQRLDLFLFSLSVFESAKLFVVCLRWCILVHISATEQIAKLKIKKISFFSNLKRPRCFTKHFISCYKAWRLLKL